MNINVTLNQPIVEIEEGNVTVVGPDGYKALTQGDSFVLGERSTLTIAVPRWKLLFKRDINIEIQ
jgi:hypothetical protein